MAYLWAYLYMCFLFRQCLWRNLKWLITICIPHSFLRNHWPVPLFSQSPVISSDESVHIYSLTFGLSPVMIILQGRVSTQSKAFLQIYWKLTPVNMCAVAKQQQRGVTDTWSSLISLQLSLLMVNGLCVLCSKTFFMYTVLQIEGSLYMPPLFRT